MRPRLSWLIGGAAFGGLCVFAGIEIGRRNSDPASVEADRPPPGYCLPLYGSGGPLNCFETRAACLAALHPGDNTSICKPTSEVWVYEVRFRDSNEPTIKRVSPDRATCEETQAADVRNAREAHRDASFTDCVRRR